MPPHGPGAAWADPVRLRTRGRRAVWPAVLSTLPYDIARIAYYVGGLMAVRGFDVTSWGITGPAILWVVRGAALGAATYRYQLRRRGVCRGCGQG